MKSTLTLENTTMVVPHITAFWTETPTGHSNPQTRVEMYGRMFEFNGDQRLILAAAIEEFYERNR